MFEDGKQPKIIYCYSKMQKIFLDIEKTVAGVTLHEGLPDYDDLKSKTDAEEELLLVIDDLIFDTINSKDIADLFCTGRHLNLSIIFLTQNVLEQGKYARSISLNACYIILFRNIRDKKQVKLLASQIFPGKVNTFMDVYDDVMSEPYGYIVIDVHPCTENKYRLRSKVFPGEDMAIYRI